MALPLGILFSVGFTIGWPYFQSIGKEEITKVDLSHPSVRENRMIRPHYTSTDKKNQPFELDADWATQNDKLADLVKPQGSLTVLKGQTFNLEAQKGKYNNQAKILDLEGKVTLTSTDGYHVQTEKAQVDIDNKIIEGDSYIEGNGPTGEIMGQDGFRIENHSHGKKIITLKGPSRVVITKEVKLKEDKEEHAQ